MITRDITLISGQNLGRGALLGKITASGKYTLSLSASGDGSQVPCALLVHDTNATAGDQKTAIYESGEFNAAAIAIGAGHTIASVRDGLRDLGIHLKAIVPA
ncbi:MAG: head decoration protein [Rhodospirillaceae bacterium]|nr:head decoration protein [Rhodospirillaceae bacterium]